MSIFINVSPYHAISTFCTYVYVIYLIQQDRVWLG